MITKHLGSVLLVALAWWAWNGPVAEWREQSLQERLAENARNMALCLRGEAFAAGAGANTSGDPQTLCAKRHGLYLHEGQWWAYEQTRKVRYSRSHG